MRRLPELTFLFAGCFDAKINLFITRLLDYLYTEEFMASTTVTNKRNKSASPSEKGQLDEKELREIIGNGFYFNVSLK